MNSEVLIGSNAAGISIPIFFRKNSHEGGTAIPIRGLAMTRPMGSYYIVGYGEDIQIPAVDLIISERNIIGNLVGTWAELTELMALADRNLVELAIQEYKLSDLHQRI